MALQHLPSCDLSQAVNGSFLPQLLAFCLLSLPGVWLRVQGLGWGHGTESGLCPGPHTPSQSPRAATREAGPAYGYRLWAKGLPSWSTGPKDLFLKTALLQAATAPHQLPYCALYAPALLPLEASSEHPDIELE